MTTEQALITARLDRRLQDVKSVQRDHQRRFEDLQRHYANEKEDAIRLCDVYVQGVCHASEGQPIETNPHPAETTLWAEWNAGWTDADKERKDQ